MPLKNPMGDFEITDPRAMRALAHPVRLAILTYLQRHGPHTATRLAPHVGATPSVASWHLRHLAGFGLVVEAESPDRRQRFWKAASRGFRYEMTDDDEGRAAGRLLREAMHRANLDQIDGWTRDKAPRLEGAWERVAGSANTRVTVTATEAAEILDGVERLLAPYVHRPESEVPAGARSLRYLRYSMPETQSADRDE